MERGQESAPATTVHAENVGGIQTTKVNFEPGVTILVGRNATNRTSFLQAIMAGLGSENVTMKGDADEAKVTLELGTGTYTQRSPAVKEASNGAATRTLMIPS